MADFAGYNFATYDFPFGLLRIAYEDDKVVLLQKIDKQKIEKPEDQGQKIAYDTENRMWNPAFEPEDGGKHPDLDAEGCEQTTVQDAEGYEQTAVQDAEGCEQTAVQDAEGREQTAADRRGKTTSESESSAQNAEAREQKTALTDQVYQQVMDYLQGKRTQFDFPYQLKGTDFQKTVWAQLLKIPYGQTRTYKDIAIAIGKPRASHAVGAAVGRNPILLVVPCHRVIGSDGGLTGYGGGLPMKQALLDLERGE